MEKNIYLQYPYDETGNKVQCDGKFHAVIPQSLLPIKSNKRTYYIMEYIDKSCNEMGIAILTKIKDKYVNVILDDYEPFMEQLPNIKIGNNILNNIELSEYVGITETVEVKNLLENTENQIKIHRYVPVISNDKKDIKDRVFSLEKIYDTDAIQTEYSFTKEKISEIEEDRIKAGIRLGYINNSNMSYRFQIMIQEGTTQQEIIINEEGTGMLLEKALLPGMHTYEIIYAMCPEEEVEFMKKQDKLIITNIHNWLDYKTPQQAFIDGCQGNLEAEFHNVNQQNSFIKTKS